MSTPNFQPLSNFIWSVADLLRGPYRPPQYERVMLPMTVLRRFDCVLEGSKPAVLRKFAQLQASGKVKNPDATLNSVAKDSRFCTRCMWTNVWMESKPSRLYPVSIARTRSRRKPSFWIL